MRDTLPILKAGQNQMFTKPRATEESDLETDRNYSCYWRPKWKKHKHFLRVCLRMWRTHSLPLPSTEVSFHTHPLDPDPGPPVWLVIKWSSQMSPRDQAGRGMLATLDCGGGGKARQLPAFNNTAQNSEDERIRFMGKSSRALLRKSCF
jgi:hypothetical protein